MDLVGPMGVSCNNFRYIMMVIDSMTKYLVTIPLKSKEALEVAHSLYEKVICVHGVPRMLVLIREVSS